ncbi:YbfB/YjiJ family MFS transporter [Roseateles asaccharophilus]|uniref:MFS family arabinose efflux permease n=1 Tax=Roseateles asaccharophilus TaxID=582607 RepID=A0ABU2A8W7_9BURK|nr:YbfB/YjiJ family MFS transporter [Roseateles asaccharophilus]MDR7333637.1 putative MFS family arabinose efflux permease [Roseateles asaccharophilus]
MTLRPWQILLGGICALVLTIGLARFAYTPLLPLMQAQAGLGVADGGLLAAINYAGYMSGALLAAWIESPVWRQRLYSWGLPLALGVTALMGWSTSFGLWAVSRYLGGLCGAAGMLLGSGLVQGWLIRSGRRPELGIYFIGLGLGIVVSALGAMGMTQGGLDWAAQWQGFALLGLVFLLPAWAWRPPVPPPAQKAVAGTAPSRRWMVLMVLAYFCAGWGFVINATFTVAIVEKQPVLAGQGPWAWLLVGLAATPAVFLWDRVARRLGDVGALLMAFGLQIVGVLLPALAGGLVAALLGALLYGATFIGIVSLTLALVGRRSPANPGKAMARLTLGYGVAQISAPALTGHMVEASGSFDAALWLTAAVMAAGMAALVGVLRESRA